MSKLVKPKESFSWAPNYLVNDPKLSAKAKGLWLYLNSKPEGWNFTYRSIASQMADGDESVRTGLKELRDAGYLRISRVFSDSVYELSIVPISHTMENPQSGKSTRISKTDSIVKQNISKIDTNVSIGETPEKSVVPIEPKVVRDSNAEVVEYGKPEINELFNMWHDIFGFPIRAKIKLNRFAATNLLKKMSRDQIEVMLRALATGENYPPRVGNFVDVQDKLDKIFAWARDSKMKGSQNESIVV